MAVQGSDPSFVIDDSGVDTTREPSVTSTYSSQRSLIDKKRERATKDADKQKANEQGKDDQSPQKTVKCGCFPYRRGRRVKRNVKFDEVDVPPTEPGTPAKGSAQRKRSLSSKGLKIVNTGISDHSALIRRSTSKRSFYSCISALSRIKNSAIRSLPSSTTHCACNFKAHRCFDPSMPITLPTNGVEPGSYAELKIHAQALVGKWITILERSASLDEQMSHVGIGKMKRMVMNRLAIPLTAVLEEDDTLLHCWISTPVGDKHTRSSLVGRETYDTDADLGDWTAVTSMVYYNCTWFCSSKPIRAMQMKRTNPKFGVAYETRAILPDKQEGKILLYNITIYPNGDDQDSSKMLCVDRIYRPN